VRRTSPRSGNKETRPKRSLETLPLAGFLFALTSRAFSPTNNGATPFCRGSKRTVWLAPMTPQASRSRPKESHYNPPWARGDLGGIPGWGGLGALLSRAPQTIGNQSSDSSPPSLIGWTAIAICNLLPDVAHASISLKRRLVRVENASPKWGNLVSFHFCSFSIHLCIEVWRCIRCKGWIAIAIQMHLNRMPYCLGNVRYR